MKKNATADQAIDLLKSLIAIPSLSREESETCSLLKSFLDQEGVKTKVIGNNVWCVNKYFDKNLPTILLNSHHDTVKPNSGYSKDPFLAIIEDEKLFGLGSNDAGGPLVSLLITFLHYYHDKLPFNLLFAATAEEEISGKNGIVKVIPELPSIAFAIVGEPTEMKMAVAEKGLVVIDCVVTGEAGHAARKNGKNAIELALNDLQWIKDFKFERKSKMLGEVNMSVTQINAGTQHNVIPDKCDFVIDVRTTDAYTNEEVVEQINNSLMADVRPRSTRLQPSGISPEHPLFVAADALGIATFGSPTMSDQALMPFPSVKIGPGKSERSHTADEFIYLNEIKNGIEIYIQLISSLKNKI